MLCFVVAFAEEARPIIDHFRLKLVPGVNAFSLFTGEEKRLIVSGPGKNRAAQAVAYLAGWLKAQKSTAWLNVGIAGHETLELGTGVLASKISDAEHKQNWYPPLTFDWQEMRLPVMTVTKPEEIYSEGFLYEMEASGFYEAAIRFSTAELIQCYKIISDNQKSPISNVSPESARTLINKNLDAIDKLSAALSNRSGTLEALGQPAQLFEQLVKQWHFTATEEHRLNRLLKRIETLGLLRASDITERLKQLNKAQDVLTALEKEINFTPFACHPERSPAK